TRAANATTGPEASASRAGVRGGSLCLPGLDRSQNPLRRLLDRQLGDVDHGTTEAAVDRRRLLELLVDLHQLGVLSVAGAQVAQTAAADLSEPLRVDRQADDLRRI